MSSGNAGCCYCGEEGHTPVHCKKVASIEDRKRYIRENGRCSNCLRRGHIGRDFRSTSKCGKCNGRHLYKEQKSI